MKIGDTTKYSRFNRLLYDHPELLDDFNWKWLYKMRIIFPLGRHSKYLSVEKEQIQHYTASEHNYLPKFM